jgi:hypothetical protein
LITKRLHLPFYHASHGQQQIPDHHPRQVAQKFHLKPGMKLVFDEKAPDLRAKPKHEFDLGAMRGALGAANDFEPAKTSTQILKELRDYERKSW